MSLRFVRFGPSIGAEVGGVRIAQLESDDASWLSEGLWRFRVLVFRDQVLSRSEFVRFARLWGPLEEHPTLPRAPDAPDVSLIASGPGERPSSGRWHFDAAWGRAPSAVMLLRNANTPPVGGDTLFVDAVGAGRQLVRELGNAVLAAGVRYEPRGAVDGRASGPPRSTPLFWRHPVTGEDALLANTYLIRGFTGEVPARLSIRAVESAIEAPDLMCRVAWQPNSLVVWDNRATLHRLCYDFLPFIRRMERISVAEVPDACDGSAPGSAACHLRGGPGS
ncbi:MAG: tauD [Actinomycetia bacterium]|nr:tauD [Actinomycetes bacterium]